MITFSFRPTSGSRRPLAAASVSTRVVSWKLAAASGRRDPLVGLKENVIMGHLVPAGTGFPVHRVAEPLKMVEEAFSATRRGGSASDGALGGVEAASRTNGGEAAPASEESEESA